jgi:hypothetical protein
MHYLHFEEYSKSLESLSTALKLRVQTPEGATFFLSCLFFLTLFMYLSGPYNPYGKTKST